MRMFDRLRDWAATSDTERVNLDRRAFLRGMAVTSAGLLVPGATVFDMLGPSPRRLPPVVCDRPSFADAHAYYLNTETTGYVRHVMVDGVTDSKVTGHFLDTHVTPLHPSVGAPGGAIIIRPGFVVPEQVAEIA